MYQRFLLLASVLASLLATLTIGCGSPKTQNGFQNGSPTTSGNAASSSSSFLVTLLPAAPTVIAGQGISFTAPFVGNGVWKVNGVQGGDSIHGSIDSVGTYIAPAVAPADAVTVTAELGSFDSSPSASATVTVLNSGTIAATPNPLVAAYTITIPDKSSVNVDFGQI